MIIFDIDGTLANCDHRKYLIDPQGDHPDYYRNPCKSCNDGSHHKIDPQIHKVTGEFWKPDWQAFFEACDKDIPVPAVCHIFDKYEVDTACDFESIRIWTGRCESVREKTMDWLCNHLFIPSRKWLEPRLKMRPIGDITLNDQLKEKWVDEAISNGNKIQMVFEDDPATIQMLKRKGIFVFDCNQNN